MKKIALVLLLALTTSMVFAQEVSKKQEITLFGISTGKAEMDGGVVSSVDARIKEVFINLGRFEVTGLTYQLEGLTVEGFLEKIKAYKEERVKIPMEVQLGEKMFTKADFDQLVSSFLLIVPKVNNYFVADKGRQWEANIDMSITIIDVATMKAIPGGQINMVKKGSDKDANSATQKAVDQIVSELTYKVRSIDQFKIKSGIVDIKPLGEVYMELGKDMGVLPGDEFAVVKVKGSGDYAIKDEQGLLVIKNVQEKFSVGQVIYGDVQLADSTIEIPRLGVDVELYGLLMNRTNFEKTYKYTTGIATSEITNSAGAVIGLRGTGTRGFYDMRPYVSMEVPFNDFQVFGVWAIPFNAWVGGEFIQYINRFNISLSAGIGASGLYIWLIDALNEAMNVKADSAVLYTGIGGQVQARVDFLATRDFKLRVHGDARVMFSGLSGYLGSYYAYGAGIALIMKN